MQRPRYPLRIDWITLALIFVISLILYYIPYLHELLIIAAITVILYTFVKSLY
jgi:chromate transport protein ChrA